MATANGELQYFVGREDELQALRDFVADPSPGVLLVTGPPGTGKSFLLRQFAEGARQDAELLVCLRSLTAEAAPIDLAHLALDIMQSRHSVLDSDLLKGLRDGVIALFGGAKYHGMEVGQAVGKLIGRSVDMQREALQAGDYTRLLAGVIRETAGAMKGDQHLVGILDADKYFQQESLREALDHIIATLPDRAKLILGLREGDPFLKAHDTLGREQVRSKPLSLGELAYEAAEELIEQRFVGNVSADIVDGLIGRCGLLPLALDAGIKLIQQSDKESVEALQDLPGDCSATNLMHQLARAALATERPGLDIVRVLALTREALSLEELAVVLHISGRPEDAADVDSVLRWRSIVDVLERRGTGEVHYRPYHDWMREAILRLTPPPVARPLHQALGKFYWARLEENKQDEKAIRHCAYHLALGNLDTLDAKEQLLNAVVNTVFLKSIRGYMGEVDDELTLSRKLLEDDTLDIGAEVRVEICNQSGILAMDTGQLLTALWHFQQVRGLVPELEKVSEECAKSWLSVALGNVGMVYERMGRLADSLDAYEEALGIDREIGYLIGEAGILANIANVYVRMGKLDAALELFGEALDIQIKVRNVLGVSAILGNIGAVNGQMGNVDGALVACRASLGIQRQMGYASGEAANLANIGLVHEDKGELREALDHLRQSLVIFEQIGAALEIERIDQNIARIEEKLDKSDR